MIIKKERRKDKNNRYSQRSIWSVQPETFFELIYLIFRERKDKYLKKNLFVKNCWYIDCTF